MVEASGIFIALGSNLGDRAGHIRSALRELEQSGDVHVLRCSSLHETAPAGGPPGQPRFLNAVAELQTELSPADLLARLAEIEQRHGRERTVRNGPRTLDLDLLLYHDEVIDQPELTVPHPRMWQRPFVTEPLAEICDAQRRGAARALRAPLDTTPPSRA
jgi:2-amino-4-hydroxy-6-hydroxymethyldihydropteridine diphosphokinase